MPLSFFAMIDSVIARRVRCGKSRPVVWTRRVGALRFEDAKAAIAASWGGWLKAAGLNEDTPTAQA
jgi:hypothetical protein